MTVTEIQKRAEKSFALKCIRLKDGTFLCESGDKKIMYPVSIGQVNGVVDGKVSCTCADFQRNSKTDSAFRCKHILAALECETDNEAVEPAERKKVKLNPEYIVQLQGKDFIKYQGILDMAHQRGITKLEVEILQYPSTENGNEAICRATAETRHERFTDIGDASPRNTNKMIASHIIRMASTRAKARCMRDLVNLGITSIEELGDIDLVVGSDNGKSIKINKPVKKEIIPDVKPAGPDKPKVSPAKEVKPSEPTKIKPEPVKTEAKPQSIQPKDQSKDNVAKVSEAQLRALMNVGRRRGMTTQELDDMAKKDFGVPVQELTTVSASAFLRRIQTAA